MSPTPKKVRTIILTAGVTATAVTGAWYGAGLKTKQELKQAAKTRAEATPADRIAALEQTRAGLVARKMGLERKISQLEGRRVEKRAVQVDGGGKGGRG